MIEPEIPRRGVERGPSVFGEKIEEGEVAQVHEEHAEEGEPAQAIERRMRSFSRVGPERPPRSATIR